MNPFSIPSNVGLVLEGGGFRGIFTAGVLDAFLKDDLLFPYAIGVSAGAAYGVSYVSRQYGRNLKVNNYVADPRYCSFKNWLKTGNYFNWEFVYKQVPIEHVPFDYKAFAASTTRFRVGVTNCRTGEAEYKYMDSPSPDDFRDWLTATSSIPVISKMKKIGNALYLDGGLSDSIPVQKAFQDGNSRVVVVLTRDALYRKSPMKYGKLLKLGYRRYPAVAKALIDRAECYNQSLDELEKLEKMGRAFVIRPPKPILVSRMENNTEHLNRAYEVAFRQTEELTPKLKTWLAEGL